MQRGPDVGVVAQLFAVEEVVVGALVVFAHGDWCCVNAVLGVRVQSEGASEGKKSRTMVGSCDIRAPFQWFGAESFERSSTHGQGHGHRNAGTRSPARGTRRLEAGSSDQEDRSDKEKRTARPIAEACSRCRAQFGRSRISNHAMWLHVAGGASE